MTGPEHYHEAERLLTTAAEAVVHASQDTSGSYLAAERLADALEAQARAVTVAQVHATLALTAAITRAEATS